MAEIFGRRNIYLPKGGLLMERMGEMFRRIDVYLPKGGLPHDQTPCFTPQVFLYFSSQGALV